MGHGPGSRRTGRRVPFKRALTLAMKTIAGEPGARRSPSAPSRRAFRATEVKLPQARRSSSTRQEVAITRGIADSLRHASRQSRRPRASPAIARKATMRAPCSRRSSRRASSAIGARAMPGMASNLAAMLDDRYQKQLVGQRRRPQGCAARGSRGAPGARAADRRRAAAACPGAGRSVAAMGRGESSRASSTI